MRKKKNQCTVACLFAKLERCECVCKGLNHGRWSALPDGSGSRSMEDKATVATDLSAIGTLDRVSKGKDRPRR